MRLICFIVTKNVCVHLLRRIACIVYDAGYCNRLCSVVGLYVRVSVCMSVGHDRELCKNGWTDRDTVWGTDSCGPREPCIRLGQGRTNPFADARGDNEAMRPCVKILWLLVSVIAAFRLCDESRVCVTYWNHSLAYTRRTLLIMRL